MKTFNKILMSLGVAATALGFSSCVGDLDLSPNDPSSYTDVSNDMDAVFADLFFNFSTFGANGSSPVVDFDGGMSSFQRAIFIAEEMPTDEASWLWDQASYGTLNYGYVVPTVDCAYGFYSRLVINITLCTQFVSTVNDGTFVAKDGESESAFAARKAEYVRQATILWGACYYYMLSFYDNIPFAPIDQNAVGTLPEQLSRAEVLSYVTSALEEVSAAYNELGNPTPVYGYVGVDACDAILAKIYLNGKVWTGTDYYAKCYEKCENIISRLGKGGYWGNGLARDYKTLFGYNNDKYVVGHSGSEVNEIIWSLAQDRVNLLSWSGATFLIAGWLGTNGVEVTVATPTQDASLDGTEYENEDGTKGYYKYYDSSSYASALETYNSAETWQKTISEEWNNTYYSFDPDATGWISQQWFNAGGVWKCMVARKSFVKKFEWNDVDMSESDDTRVYYWQTSSHGFTADNISLLGDDWGTNGYITPKYSNWAFNDDGSIDYVSSPSATEQVGGDYAVIRLAEIYLTAAEAMLQGGGGSQAKALDYVNYIRRRAYGDTNHDWTSVSMTDLQNERCRELYQENVRRTDLIRWDLWCTGYTWEWKGGIESGTNLAEYTKCYPIPSRVMNASNYKQISGY